MMKRIAATTLLALGVVLLTVAPMASAKSSNITEWIGSFLPGLACLIVGWVLHRSQPTPRTKLWKPFAVGLTLSLIVVTVRFVFLPRFYAEDDRTRWTYQSLENGFTITLPSDDWKEVPDPKFSVAFVNRSHPARVGVDCGEATREHFLEKSVPQLREYILVNSDSRLTKPQYLEGETETGNRYAYWTFQEKTDHGIDVFLAFSRVWCKDKAISVGVTLEGQLRMKSQMGREVELDYFEKAAKVICLSIK